MAALSSLLFPLVPSLHPYPSKTQIPMRPLSVSCAASAAPPEPAKDNKPPPPSQIVAQAEEPKKPSAAPPPPKPKKPVYSLKKGQIVRVDKEKYLNSINYLSVGHPPYYKGLDYIYEDRGEVLDVRIFETGEHALLCWEIHLLFRELPHGYKDNLVSIVVPRETIAWVGIPTAPAWLPTEILIKSEKLDYERI